MESSWLRLLTTYTFNFSPFSLVNIKLMNVIEPLLISIYSAKYVNLIAANDCWVTVPGLWRWSISSMNFVPVIRQETVLEYVVHRIMPIPTSEDKHWVLENDGWMPKSIQRLDSVALNFFPFVLFVFNATFVHISESFLSVVSSVDEETSIP